jgi:hypothetical protein
MALIVR